MSEQQAEKSGGQSQALDVKGLALAALASVVAAVVTAEFFPKGALITTAVTPVIVTLVREGLRKPADKITATAARVAVAPVRGSAALAGSGAVRGANTGLGGRRAEDAEPATRRFDPRRLEGSGLATGRFDQRRLEQLERSDGEASEEDAAAAVAVAPPPAPFDDTRSYDPTRSIGTGDHDPAGDSAPAAAAGQPTERKVYGRKRFRLKLAIATGLLAFGIAAVALTASELALGGPVGGGDGKTSLFGGGGGGQGADDGGGGDGGSSSDPGSGGSAPSDSVEPQAVPEESAPAPEEPAPEEPAPTEEPAAPVEPAPSAPAPAE